MVLACRSASDRWAVRNVNHSSESIFARSSYQSQTTNNLPDWPGIAFNTDCQSATSCCSADGDTWSYKMCKAPVKLSSQQTNTQLFTDRMPSRSDRFVKKALGGSPTVERVEAPQALTCKTNTGVRIDPPGAQIDGDSGGQKNHWEG